MTLMCILISRQVVRQTEISTSHARDSTDRRSGITNDPNRPDDPQCIVRLIVITVSLETVKIVKSLPPLATG